MSTRVATGMTERTHFVYRVWDAYGTLLYIGCTKDPGRRWISHKADRSLWVPYAASFKLYGPYSKAQAFARENAAIESERPAFNALTEHRRSRHANYTRRQALVRSLRSRRPDLFICEIGTAEWDEYLLEMDRIEKQAADEVPSIGGPERHAAYLARRGRRHLVAVS